MKDKEINLDEIETSHTTGGVGKVCPETDVAVYFKFIYFKYRCSLFASE
jgi:hypothetical protein